MRGSRTIKGVIVLVLLLTCVPVVRAEGRSEFLATERSALGRLLDNHQVINIVDDFLAFWDAASDKPLPAQRRMWRRMVENKHRDYFERAVYRGADRAQRRAMLDTFLVRVPSEIDAIRKFNETIYGTFITAVVHFKEIRFREYEHRQDVYIGLSLFRFDGAVRPVHNEEGVPDTLCLGAEVLAGYTDEQIRIAIMHEMFHLYHFNFLFALPRAWSPEELRTAHIPLMVEGLAVAGSEEAYPSQPQSLYLHYSDGELAINQEALTSSAGRFLEMIQSDAPPSEYESWFMRGSSGDALPRGGYLLGYQITRRLLASFTFEQLVRMSPAQLREHAEEQLSAMAGYRLVLMAHTN